MALENPGQNDGVYLQFHGPHSLPTFPSQAALPHIREWTRHSLGGQRCAISYPLFVLDTFSCKIRKAEGEEDRLGVDALSKTGSLTCEEQEASPSEPELKSKGRAVNAAH